MKFNAHSWDEGNQGANRTSGLDVKVLTGDHKHLDGREAGNAIRQSCTVTWVGRWIGLDTGARTELTAANSLRRWPGLSVSLTQG